MSNKAEPIGLLIAAMGGEGGGVLRQWLVDAAMAHGFAVQSTSIPGVAQRTGATTYYIEMQPLSEDQHRPVMSLYPLAGNVDIMVASELIEAGRAMQNGFVTPNCTTLIASTHRVYTVMERTAMGDGRFDGTRVLKAAESLAKQAVLFDMDAMAKMHNSVINAVLLGAIAGSGRLPIPPEGFKSAIKSTGRAVEQNLSAFQAGFAAVERGELRAIVPDSDLKRPWRADRPMADALHGRIREKFPLPTHTILKEGVNRLFEYQNLAYAELFLQRLMRINRAELAFGGHGELVRDAGRHLALWMCYDDVIRVAQTKLRPERLAQIRADVRALPHEPIRVSEYLKPGLDEIAALLPTWIARPLISAAERSGLRNRLNIGMTVNSTALWGYLVLRSLGSLKFLRPVGHRFKIEQSNIDEWIDDITKATALNLSLASEIIKCQQLLKGYGETHRHGWDTFSRIMETLVRPALSRKAEPKGVALTIALAREAALADPSGSALQSTLNNDSPAELAAE